MQNFRFTSSNKNFVPHPHPDKWKVRAITNKRGEEVTANKQERILTKLGIKGFVSRFFLSFLSCLNLSVGCLNSNRRERRNTDTKQNKCEREREGGRGGNIDRRKSVCRERERRESVWKREYVWERGDIVCEREREYNEKENLCMCVWKWENVK